MLKTFALAGLMAALALPALAQNTTAPAAMSGDASARPAASPAMTAARAKVREQCAADMKTYCADAPQGGGGMMQCMRDNAAKMSEGCKSAMGEMRAARGG